MLYYTSIDIYLSNNLHSSYYTWYMTFYIIIPQTITFLTAIIIELEIHMNCLSYIIRQTKRLVSALFITATLILPLTDMSALATPDTLHNQSPYITSDNWPAAPTISANSAILINVNTGTILYDKNCDKRNYPASMTKVLTALLTIENTSLNDVVTYTDPSIFNLEEGASYLALNHGEQLTVEQSLYGLMLASANDVANGLAVHTGGSIDNFVNMMNERAAQIGCKDTHFANANGLHDDNHYTTCHDMALIMMDAIKNNSFLSVSSTNYYMIPPTNLQPETRHIRTLHSMMNPLDNYYYEYCIAGKTGYTDQAGTTLVTYCKKGDLELISVIMDSYFTQYTDTITLMNYGFSNFALYNMADEMSGISNTHNKTSLLASVLPASSSLITIERDSTIILPSFETLDSVETEITYSESADELTGTIATINYYYDGIKVGDSLLKFTSGETTSAFEHLNIPTESDTTDAIFSNEGKILISYKMLLIYIGSFIVFLIILIFVAIYFKPKSVRLRRAEKRRKKRIKQSYFN